MRDEGMNEYNLFGGLSGVRQEGICFEKCIGNWDIEHPRYCLADSDSSRTATYKADSILDVAMKVKEKEKQDKATEERLIEDLEDAGLYIFRGWSKYAIKDLEKMVSIVKQKWFKDFIARRDRECPDVRIIFPDIATDSYVDANGDIWIDATQSEEEIKRFLLGNVNR